VDYTSGYYAGGKPVKKVNICLCTYKREEMLAACLQSLAEIHLPVDTEVSLTIIDNDSNRTAEIVAKKYRKIIPFPVYCHCENKRGIPCARNRAIEETRRLESDYLVFIDDDEKVEPAWLEKIYTYCQQQGGNVIVSGGVVSELPEETPDHIAGLFNKKQRLTGAQLSSCATDNVLLPVDITDNLRFDETNPLAGGTDTIFFYQATKAGATILKCAEARVHEMVPANRTTLKWLSRRKFRAGITVAWRKQQEGRQKLSIIISSIGKICLDSIVCSIMMCTGKKVKRNLFWLKVCRSCGILSGVMGRAVDSYRNVDGQ